MFLPPIFLPEFSNPQSNSENLPCFLCLLLFDSFQLDI